MIPQSITSIVKFISHANKESDSDAAMGEQLVQGLHDRLNKQNKDVKIIFLGETGSGKSWASLRMAEKLDPSFNVDRICFSIADVLKLANSGLKKGSIIVLEEVGVNVSSRRWQKNEGINDLIQTWRHQNLGLIMNCPSLELLDKIPRGMIQVSFKMIKIDHGAKHSIARPYVHNKDGQTGSGWVGYPLIKKKLISEVHFSLPGIALRRRYEAKKVAFTRNLNEKLLQGEIAKENLRLLELNKAKMLRRVR